jgi:hypothetical protein
MENQSFQLTLVHRLVQLTQLNGIHRMKTHVQVLDINMSFETGRGLLDENDYTSDLCTWPTVSEASGASS